MAAARSSAVTSGSDAAMVSAAGTTIAPGVIIAPRWMSSISLSRASATLIAMRSASPSASLRNASSARPSAVPRGGDPGADGVGCVQRAPPRGRAASG